MARRAQRLIDLDHSQHVRSALLVAGNRIMKASEGEDVEEGMTEIDYMRKVVAERLVNSGILTSMVRVESGIGDEVMDAGAERVGDIADEFYKVGVISNAGAWVQNVGQMRRALRKVLGVLFDKRGQHVIAVSDNFPLGTGAEPTSIYQNPFSAAGQIVRNAQELVRHY